MTNRRFLCAIYIYIGEVPRCESLFTTRHSMGDFLKFKYPFSWMLSGTSGSGKKSFCIRFLKNLKTLGTVPYFSGGVVWCYSEISAIPYQQLVGNKHFRFHEGVPAHFNNKGENSASLSSLNSAYSKDVCDLLTKGNHNRNISVILITQNLLHQGKFCRDVSLNAKYIVVLKNVTGNNSHNWRDKYCLTIVKNRRIRI